MRLVSGLLFSALASLLANAGLADDSSKPVRVETTANMEDGSKVVCRYLVHEGMLLRRPECHSPNEWEAILHTRQREISEFQQRMLTLHR